MKIIALSGALRRASTNTGLLRALRDLAPNGIEIDIVTLHGIPLFDEDLIAESGKPVVVTALAERIRAADGIIIATPEYQFSVPGYLFSDFDSLFFRGLLPGQGRLFLLHGVQFLSLFAAVAAHQPADEEVERQTDDQYHWQDEDAHPDEEVHQAFAEVDQRLQGFFGHSRWLPAGDAERCHGGLSLEANRDG